MSLIKLFFIFVKIGAILLGGGYVILPIMTNEFVEKRNLLSQEELMNFFALSQSLPGIIATNISMFVGYKLKGKIGAIVAMFGVIFVPFICIVLLASVLEVIASNEYVKGAFWGVGIAVIALITLTVREMWQKTNKDWFFYILFVSALCALLFTNLSPVYTILVFSIIGVSIKRIMRARS